MVCGNTTPTDVTADLCRTDYKRTPGLFVALKLAVCNHFTRKLGEHASVLRQTTYQLQKQCKQC
jgi:hypothetical protein